MHNLVFPMYVCKLKLSLTLFQYLTEIKFHMYRITSEKDGLEACNILHAAGPSKVCSVHTHINGRCENCVKLSSNSSIL